MAPAKPQPKPTRRRPVWLPISGQPPGERRCGVEGEGVASQVCAARVAKAARCEPGPSWAKVTGAQARSTQGRRAPTGGPAVQLETAILDSPGCTPRARRA
jgi:hypothetical protein